MMKKKYNLNFNYLIADFVSQLNLGAVRKLRFIKVVRTKTTLRLLRILYKQGVIRAFRIINDYVAVYFKYNNGQPIGKFKIISRPGKRCFWTLNKLSKNFNNSNFSGFYIISSQQGFVTSNFAILSGHVGGEVIMKVEI